MDDLQIIESYCKQAAVAAVADLIRREGGPLAISAAPYRPPAVTDTDDQIIPSEHEPRHVTTSPVEYVDDRTWWQRVDKFVLFLRVLGVLAVIGACIGLVWVVMSIVAAVTTALITAIPTLLGIAAVVALVMLLAAMGGGRGGGGFSGTFQGRMH